MQLVWELASFRKFVWIWILNGNCSHINRDLNGKWSAE
jgi:hypothetical protein